jgi:hypothetical protein
MPQRRLNCLCWPNLRIADNPPGADASQIAVCCRGAAFIDFDPEKHEIGRRYFGGAMGGCPFTNQGEGERYRVVNNRLILIQKQEFELFYKEAGGVDFCDVTVSDLVNGTMRVTEVRRYDAEGKRVK